MDCPKCPVQAQISRVYTKVEGDSSPDTPTRVYTVQEITCMNPQCPNFNRVINTVMHLDYDSSAKGGE